jgi:phosphoribosyl 1,2-cyclic phosphodiesterase
MSGVTVCPLASGSLGNALLLRTRRAALLVDAGTTQRRMRAGLAVAGVEPDDVDAVLVTHTHRDHFSRAAIGFCVRHRIRVLSNRENLDHLARAIPTFRKLDAAGLVEPIDGDAVPLEDVVIEGFEVPHDAHGRCLGFRFRAGPARRRRTVVVATDLGHVPEDCLARFIDADAIVLESNHDPDLLWTSGRPADLVERIAGPTGHLSNAASAEAVAEVLGRSHPGRVRHVVLAHLSRDCNTAELALEAQAFLAERHGGRTHFAAATQFAPGPLLAL